MRTSDAQRAPTSRSNPGCSIETVAIGAVALALAAIGCLAACATVTHPPKARPSSGALPEIGTRMPDGTVYAGLSMDTGKPSYVAAAGGKMPDGTVYAGVSPDTNQALYTTPADAPDVYTWDQAMQYCKMLLAAGHQDWRVPSIGELALQFNNRADIGGFNETGMMEHATGYYWSSSPTGDAEAWAQRFNDGFHEHPGKNINSAVRCVR